MNLHLFSTPGDDIRDIVEAGRPYLEDKDDPTVAYLPLASLYVERWLEEAERAFKGLARLETVNAELMAQKEIEEVIRRASVVYVPGGNTFLLNHRLHISGSVGTQLPDDLGPRIQPGQSSGRAAHRSRVAADRPQPVALAPPLSRRPSS
jgi:hypothetical protein